MCLKTTLENLGATTQKSTELLHDNINRLIWAIFFTVQGHALISVFRVF